MSSLVALLLCVPAPQDEPRPAARAARTEHAPEIDGKLDEAAWAAAEPIGELTQIDPAEGVPMSERTEVRFLFDADHLYIGVRCNDSDADAIVTTTRDRDALLEVDDRVEMVIDTFHDRRNAFFFQMNAGGSKGDALVTGNGANFNKPWDGIWDGVATVDAGGWSCEMSLPFKTLNFAEGQTTWGFNIERFIGRKREHGRWSLASRDRSLFSIYHAGEVTGLEGIRQGIGLDVVPFYVAHWRNDRPGEDKTLLGEPGFDAFYKIIPSLTLSLTVNTDFAETEVDQRQINLTRFPLFFPERRDFFLQDSGLFEFGFNAAGGGGDRGLIPFFSRRIGLSADGEEVPIIAGAKLTGRAGDYGIGVLDVQTDDLDELDGQNLFAGKISRNVGEQSTVGMLVTHGDPAGEVDNTVFGVDSTYRSSTFLGDRNLIATGFGLISDTEDVSGDDKSFGGGLSSSGDLWSWEVNALEVQENFDPRLGFVPRNDIRRYGGALEWQPRPDVDGVRQLEFSVDSVLFTDTDDELETWETEIQPLGVFFESGDLFLFEAVTVHDELTEDFEISDGIVIPVGEYDYAFGRFSAASGQQRKLAIAVDVEAGDFFDGERTSYSADLTVHTGPSFNGEVTFVREDVSLPGGDFDTELALVHANFSFTAELSWNNFVQWDSDSDTIGVNSRLRWIPVPQQEIFLVFNETLENDSGTTAPVFEELSFKITYALRF